jgi:hypothetical protein
MFVTSIEARDLLLHKTNVPNKLNTRQEEMHYTTQLNMVHLTTSLKLSLMLVRIQKLKIIKEKLQLTMRVDKNIQQSLLTWNNYYCPLQKKQT